MNIIQTPSENTVFSNTAPINIVVDSLLGAGHYFVLKIYVNGALYDTQPRSKTTDHRVEIDFSGMVTGIFTTEFTTPTTTNVLALSGLLKNISLVVEEYQEATDDLMAQLVLPSFYLVNSHTESNLVFNQLQPLSIYTDVIKVPVDKHITFPFFAIKETMVKVYINYVNVDELLITDAFGIYTFNLLLSHYNITENDHVTFSIYDGTTTLEKTVVPIVKHYYNVHQLLLKNNHAAWEVFYTFGQYQSNTKLIKKSHQITDVLDHSYTSIIRKSYYLNTGNYHSNYGATVENVLATNDLFLSVDNSFICVTIENTKSEKVTDLPDYYSIDLVLKNNQEPEAENTVLYDVPDALVNSTITGEQETLITLTKAQVLANFNGETPTEIRFTSTTHADVQVELTTGVANVNTTTSYNWDEFLQLSFTPLDYGTPFVTMGVKLLNANGWSNTANIYFNVFPDLSNNQPPSISLASTMVVRPSELSKTLTATVTEPDGHNFTVLWTQESGQPVTMNNTTTTSLQVAAWTGIGTYEFKITATDEFGAAAEKTITLHVMNYEVNALAKGNQIGFYGGKPGTSIDWKCKIDFRLRSGQFNNSYTDSDTVALYLDSEIIAEGSLNQGLATVNQAENYFERTDTFDASGKIKVALSALQSVSGAKGIWVEWDVSLWVVHLNDDELELGNLSKISFMNEYES